MCARVINNNKTSAARVYIRDDDWAKLRISLCVCVNLLSGRLTVSRPLVVYTRYFHEIIMSLSRIVQIMTHAQYLTTSLMRRLGYGVYAVYSVDYVYMYNECI